MALIRLIEGVWRFLEKGKHAGESLEEVAKKDPRYLSWAWRETSGEVSVDAFHAIDDVVRRHGINVQRDRNIDNQSYRKHRITHDRSRKRR